jgi:NADH-quinone oxidoreductase subunit M
VFSRVRVGLKEYGAMKLTLYLLAGSAFLLAGSSTSGSTAGGRSGPSFDYLDLSKATFSGDAGRILFLLFYVGFGVLAGIWPFHTWSPDGHAAAPAAGSMLHAGVLMKLGAYGVLRVGFGLLPEAARELAWLVGLVAVINIVYGALGASWQRDVKYLIAYSSVSHMGIVMLGLATLNGPGDLGRGLQMVAHGIMTALFFTIVNLVYHKSHTRDMTAMGGLAHAMPGSPRSSCWPGCRRSGFRASPGSPRSSSCSSGRGPRRTRGGPSPASSGRCSPRSTCCAPRG